MIIPSQYVMSMNTGSESTHLFNRLVKHLLTIFTSIALRDTIPLG